MQSAFSASGRFDSFGSQYDDFSGPGQSGRLQPSPSLGPAASIPEGAPVLFEGESSVVTVPQSLIRAGGGGGGGGSLGEGGGANGVGFSQ